MQKTICDNCEFCHKIPMIAKRDGKTIAEKWECEHSSYNFMTEDGCRYFKEEEDAEELSEVRD